MNPSMATSPSQLKAADLERVESLGDNCELGFVMQAIGYGTGGIFRWAYVSSGNLVRILDADFAGIYARDQLRPVSDGMVAHSGYSVQFHTKMRSQLSDGTRHFLLSEDELSAIHEEESRKVEYLVQKFISRAKTPGLLYVIKSNEGFRAGLAEALYAALLRHAGAPHFKLLMVTACPERAGQLHIVSRGLLEGYVDRLAPYATADDISLAKWRDILHQALQLPCT